MPLEEKPRYHVAKNPHALSETVRLDHLIMIRRARPAKWLAVGSKDKRVGFFRGKKFGRINA
jgi:hypothetical protein